MWCVYLYNRVKPYIPVREHALGGSAFFFLQFVFSHSCCLSRFFLSLNGRTVPEKTVPFSYRAKSILFIGLLALFFCVSFWQNLIRRSYAEITFART